MSEDANLERDGARRQPAPASAPLGYDQAGLGSSGRPTSAIVVTLLAVPRGDGLIHSTNAVEAADKRAEDGTGSKLSRFLDFAADVAECAVGYLGDITFK